MSRVAYSFMKSERKRAASEGEREAAASSNKQACCVLDGRVVDGFSNGPGGLGDESLMRNTSGVS